MLDIYKAGEYYQVLITPDYLEQELINEVTLAAKKDFNQLRAEPSVQILDNPQWRQKVRRLVGDNRKRFDHTDS